MGCIPIVLNSSISAVYRDVPVMVVENWEAINEDSLARFEKSLNLTDDDVIRTDVIYAGYWKKKICASKIAHS
jgi:hypothetical protein